MDNRATSLLSLRIERDVLQLSNEWAHAVVIEVDSEVLVPIDGRNFIGQPPIEILADEGFARPTSEAREVVIGRCSCGETGCGAVVARIYEQGGFVVWDCFAHGNPPPISLDASRPQADAIFFDALNYANAVRSATRWLAESA